MILQIEIDERDNQIVAINNYPTPGGGTINLVRNTHHYPARLETAELVITSIKHEPAHGVGFLFIYKIIVNCSIISSGMCTVDEFLELINY